jgi:ribosome maturation factor RimP
MEQGSETLGKVRKIAEGVCKDRGIDLFDVELLGSGRHIILRIFIDCATGITVEDCALVSREVSTALDVADPIPGKYRLEVSSPGLDRPIRHSGDARLMIGKMIDVKTRSAAGERRRFRGRLIDVQGESWVISADGEEFKIDSRSVEKAHMVYEF